MGSVFSPKEEEQTSSYSSGPPSWALPYVENFAQDADALRGRRLRPYGGQLQAGMSGMRRGGLQGAYDLASAGGTGIPDMGRQYLGDVIGGKYLSAPHLAQAAQLNVDRFMPQHTSQWARAGRSGSGLAAQAMGEGIGRAVGDVYNRERGLQQQALSFVPQFESMAYQPFQQQANIGREFEAERQREIDEDRYRFEFNRDEPYMRLQRATSLLSPISQMWGNEGEKTQTVYGQSPFQTIAGLGMTAAGMAGGMPGFGSFGSLFGGGITPGTGPTFPTAGMGFGIGGVPWT